MSGGRVEAIDAALSEAYATGYVTGDDGERFEIYPTGTDERQGRQLRELIVAERAAKTFEVGFAFGLSTLHIAAALATVGNPSASHTTVDPTEGPVWKNAGRRLAERAGVLGSLVEVVEESSHTVLPRWFAEGRCDFDIAFIDGDHRYDPAFVDVFFAERLVKPGGLIVLDDMWMPSVRTVAAFYETNVGLELLTDAMPDAFRWRRRLPWRTVRDGQHNTAIFRKPTTHTQRPGEHFVPFW